VKGDARGIAQLREKAARLTIDVILQPRARKPVDLDQLSPDQTVNFKQTAIAIKAGSNSLSRL
jgi:hypothetical protein